MRVPVKPCMGVQRQPGSCLLSLADQPAQARPDDLKVRAKPSCRYYAPSVFPRPMHQTNMILEAKRWLQQHYPYWNRTNGRDHIWLTNHDEAPW